MKTIALRPFLAAKFFLFCCAALLLLAGCDGGIRGNGRITTENRPIPDFTSVEANGALRVEWSPGGPALAVTTDENLQQHIDTRVAGNKLIIKSHGVLVPTQKLRVRITSSALSAAALYGAVQFQAVKLNDQNFYLDATGATRTTLSGTAGVLGASMTGASRLDAEDLQTRTSELSISGAGRAEVFASEKLLAAISGAGKVLYAGNPKTVEKRITGAGKISAKD